ncbi:repressor LexA [candidate division WWE3 bacterium CG10_big_fil_rev_8_21_14_0_10_32_10]|uniref:LexA repressor n=1 Tax=candidate division WWE3 bacterium CG10_big_fil_rev_8_21_14_0_10_32_10 TaxID=1975090 RepID=A0A2H0RCT7_UNCKA|nr:MAG: repressor LexA [candidate division WWE3 bacterium CG10_big_fil_rev_8_21_14_0_10_32_10]
MPVTLYKRQKELIDYLNQYIQMFGYAPTLTEIAEAMGLSSLATVHEHLQSLEKKGVIRRFEGQVRGIEVLDAFVSGALEAIELPVVGKIAAGKPIEAIEQNDQSILVSPNMVSAKKRNFVLQVKGDSMIEDGIHSGDHVIIEQQDTAENGQIVVALIDGEFATLKRFYKENGKIKLVPANSTMEPIYPQHCIIQGVVKGLIRKY